MKLSCALEEYLIDLEVKNYSELTTYNYRSRLVHWFEFTGKQDLEDLSIFDVKRYSAHMLKNGKKPSYVNVVLLTIKAFVNWCHEEGIGGWETRKWPYVRMETQVIPTFNPNQVRAIILSCSGSSWTQIRDKAILTCLVETGIRAAELCSIKPEDIREDCILIHGKGKKERRVAITPVLKKAMLRYDRATLGRFELSEPYYFKSVRGKKLTNCSLQDIVKKHCKGIEGVRCVPHDMRHFFAVQQLKMGRSLYEVSRMMGHSNIQTTVAYVNSFDEQTLLNMTDSVLMNL